MWMQSDSLFTDSHLKALVPSYDSTETRHSGQEAADDWSCTRGSVWGWHQSENTVSSPVCLTGVVLVSCAMNPFEKVVRFASIMISNNSPCCIYLFFNFCLRIIGTLTVGQDPILPATHELTLSPDPPAIKGCVLIGSSSSVWCCCDCGNYIGGRRSGAVKQSQEHAGKHQQPDVAHFNSTCLLQRLHLLLSQNFIRIIFLFFFILLSKTSTFFVMLLNLINYS